MGGVKNMAKKIKIAAVMLGLFGLATVFAFHITSSKLFNSSTAVWAQEESASDSGDTEFA